MSVVSADATELVALASAVIHAEEYLETGEPVDLAAFKACKAQCEPLLATMRSAALLPLKRSER